MANPFPPGAFFFGVQILVRGLNFCRCSTGSFPAVRDLEENFGCVGPHINAGELGPWLKHPQARGPWQLSPCHAIRHAGAICGHSEWMCAGRPCWELIAGTALLEVVLNAEIHMPQRFICITYLFVWKEFHEFLGLFQKHMWTQIIVEVN